METAPRESSDPFSWISRKLVRNALNAWYNLPRLGDHPLVQLKSVAARQRAAGYGDTLIERGRALRDVLRDAIEELRPAAEAPQPGEKRWRAYLIVKQHYAENRALEDLLSELGISRTHFHHEQASALDGLVATLQQLEYRCDPEQVNGGTGEGVKQSADATSAITRSPAHPLTRSELDQAPALHHLRAPVADFVGREAEIDQLVQALGSVEHGTSAAIVGVRGMGGLGKTELAYAVAQRLAPRFPDAQILVELHGASASPLAPEQALQAVIRAFTSETELPNDLGQLQTRYRSLLAGKRAIILADDARDAAQVRPLLTPAGCALLITSRQRFALPGLVALDLETLPPAAAEHMVLRICPRIGADAGSLAEACDGLPLALRVSASLLASDATRAVAGYLRALADARGRLARLRDPDDPALDVEASLNLSYVALGTRAQSVLDQLSVFPTSFDRTAAAAVVQLPDVSEAGAADSLLDDVLSLLYRRCLLEWNALSARYHLHDLVRAFAAARLDDLTRATLQRRHAAHYQTVLAAAETSYLAGGKGLAEGLALLDREWEHIQAGHAWAAAHADDDATAAICRAYTESAPHMLELRLPAREWIAWLEAGLAAARRLGSRAAEGRHLEHLGLAYHHLSDFGRSRACYEQAIALARECGDQRSESSALRRLGQHYRTMGASEQAIGYYEQALALARATDNRMGEGLALNSLGIAYYQLGNFRRSIAFYEQALAAFRVINDRRDQQRVIGNLGDIYRAVGDLRRALECYEQELALTREIGDRWGQANALVGLAEAHTALGQLQQARRCIEEAMPIFRAIDNRSGESHALGILGDVHLSLSEVTQAIACYKQALLVAREIGDRQYEAHTLANLGAAYAAQGAAEAAEACYAQALTMAQAVGVRWIEAITSWRFGQLLARQGQLARAVELLRMCVDFEIAIGHVEAEEHAAYLEEVLQQLAGGTTTIALVDGTGTRM